MTEQCPHEALERWWYDANCCTQCNEFNHRYLECRACSVRVMREGDEGFEERWAVSPDWWEDDDGAGSTGEDPKTEV